MTDRYYALTVVLSKDTRDDDARPIIDAIKMVKGVLNVEPHVADIDTYTNRERLWWEMRKRVLEAIDKERVTPKFATMD